VTAPLSIIIPAYNQVDYCRQCLHTLLENTPKPYKLILVNNGSTDEVPAFFDAIPNAVVVHTGRNLGFAGGINAGLAHCEGHALLLNSDTILPRGWLAPLCAALEADPRIGMVGPRSNCVSGEQQIDDLHLEDMDAINAFAEKLAQSERAKLRDVGRLVGFCLLIREAVWRDVGGLDEAFGIGNFEDDDYCMRVLRAGYRLVMAEDAFVFHYGSRTFQGMGLDTEAWNTLITHNQGVFEEKWQAAAAIAPEALARSQALNQQASAASARGDQVAAIALLKEAIGAAPAWEVNYNDLGAMLWEMGDAPSALRYFEEALRRNPHYTAARENRRAALSRETQDHEQ